VLQVSDILGSPSTAIVVGDGVSVGMVRSDRPTRSAVAALSSSRTQVFLRPTIGAPWQTIATPAAPTAYLANVLEVLPGRGAYPADQSGCEEQCGASQVQAVVGGPINTRSGALSTVTTDLAVTAPGPALEWTRSYSSQRSGAPTSDFAAGWTHTFATRLITDTGVPGEVAVLSPRGNRWRYTALGSGFRPYPGVYATLLSASGVYTQTLRDQTQYVFDATSGRLLLVRDPLGRRLTLSYAGNGRLTQVSDAADPTRAEPQL
jgi:YD repeat-containing protein